MGVVHKAQNLKVDRPVARKILPPDLTRDSEPIDHHQPAFLLMPFNTLLTQTLLTHC